MFFFETGNSPKTDKQIHTTTTSYNYSTCWFFAPWDWKEPYFGSTNLASETGVSGACWCTSSWGKPTPRSGPGNPEVWTQVTMGGARLRRMGLGREAGIRQGSTPGSWEWFSWMIPSLAVWKLGSKKSPMFLAKCYENRDMSTYMTSTQATKSTH